MGHVTNRRRSQWGRQVRKVSISRNAQKLIDEHGIDLAALEPNAKGKITVTIVNKYLESFAIDQSPDPPAPGEQSIATGKTAEEE